MKNYVFILIFNHNLFGQVNHLPKEIKFEGKINEIKEWNDSDGKHFAFTTETNFHATKVKDGSGGTDKELFAYHYQHDSITNKYKLIWKINDFIFDCIVDMEVSFIKKTFNITDLNNNGVKEIWVMYILVCHGGVSPHEMKIIMYEGNNKFAMRGHNKVFEGTDDNGVKHYDGGEYKFDENFKNSPKVFKEYAIKMWNKNIMQQKL